MWAEENSRAALFTSIKNREVFSTTGPRITVRLFGGWTFDSQDAHRPDAVRTGYRKGVPMGAELPSRPAGYTTAPRFLVSALRDPSGAFLDRIQIVKGWREDGALQEKVYDVVGSDGRVAGESGKLPGVGSTVDEEAASYTNTIGDAELAAVWEDPDFDAGQRAFYYARVLEIPTPRWTSYDALRLGADLPDEVPTQIQDRAYTSPIWYTPPGR